MKSITASLLDIPEPMAPAYREEVRYCAVETCRRRLSRYNTHDICHACQMTANKKMVEREADAE